jgi:CheY-like chemotaxis protein
MQHDNQIVDLRSGVRVLVIDKNPQVARLFSAFFRDGGYEVAVGSRSPDAISMARSLSRDLILLDVKKSLSRTKESSKNSVCIRDG